MSLTLMSKSVAYRDRDELFGGSRVEDLPDFLYLLDTYMLYDVINGNLASDLTDAQISQLTSVYNSKIFGS